MSRGLAPLHRKILVLVCVIERTYTLLKDIDMSKFLGYHPSKLRSSFVHAFISLLHGYSAIAIFVRLKLFTAHTVTPHYTNLTPNMSTYAIQVDPTTPALPLPESCVYMQPGTPLLELRSAYCYL